MSPGLCTLHHRVPLEHAGHDGGEVDRIPGFPVDTYVLTPTDAHTVSVTLPDGRVEAFELAASPASQAGVRS
jgi:hypothetical protein